MKYEGMIYRPPSEADSLILQVAVGCSYNRCTFCHSFQGKTFRIKSFEEIKEDIDEAADYGRDSRAFFWRTETRWSFRRRTWCGS